ncbi:peptidoglycan/LPS O-acetylase OafA/YrhL [Mesorhizobium soli]|uniref:acyltransferase family protein n=1 Tax=Pseudaminobacter soli (ex Li et al. 2025) TaxID=1295366 RepID=UPI002475331D|nr:acyltransferase [Mesorhizobium soli]MDH6231605.1 peptidoglycan/LPS O-acetylase OafA/YrhL [Mesorhizobium soli]
MDGLRGIAALAVLQLHAQSLFGRHLRSSYLAVDLFFLLSGLVLSHAYEERLKRGMSVRRFMLIRIVRLYPLYILGTLVGAAFLLASHVFGTSEYSLVGIAISLVFSVLFMPTPAGVFFGDISLYPFVYPAWSLFFKLVANYLYSVTLPAQATRFLMSVVGLGAVLLIWSAFRFEGLDAGISWSGFSGGFARVIFSFFLGVLLFRFPLTWRGNGLHAVLCVVVLIPIFAVPVSKDYRAIFDLAVVIFVFPVLAAIAAASEGSLRFRQCFALLGNSSYAIYAVHAPVLWWTTRVSSRVFGVQLTDLAPASGGAVLVMLLLLAFALDRYYDRPVRRILMRRLSDSKLPDQNSVSRRLGVEGEKSSW